MQLPHYNEKSGNPLLDNMSRRWNKRMRRASMTLKLDTIGGRRHKKDVLKIERARYVVMLNDAILKLIQDDARSS